MKQKIIAAFLTSLNQSIDSFQYTLDELSISILNETKSTAGDKHETALAMLQSEQSRIAAHMYDVIDNKTFFSQIAFHEPSPQVRLGSLVETNRGHFLISVALPKINVDGKIIIGISPQSPLGEHLMASSINEVIEVNGIKHTILQIT